MTTDWREAMEVHADLAEWWESESGRKFGRLFLESFNGKQPLQDHINGDIARHEYLQLQAADTYACTLEMMAVIEEASADMPDQALMPQDLPSTFGFLYLPRPFYIVDIHNKKCNIRAIRWGSLDPGNGHGIMLSFYSDVASPDDYDTSFMRKMRSSGLILLHPQPWRYGRSIKDFSSRLFEAIEQGTVGQDAVDSEIWCLRFLATFWNLCRGWADVEVQRPTERHLRKRLVRSGLWGDTPTVRVVTLRKPRQKVGPDEGHEVAWSHRWIVNVRWRQQHYPSLGPAYIDGKWNPDSHRAVYVLPFVKGPADKPLVVKKSVYRLAR